MSAIVQVQLPTPRDAPWAQIVAAMVSWAQERQIELRDAVVLVPFAQLIAPCREAFAANGGWMPRIETTQTLALALGPPATPAPDQIHFDVAVDQALTRRLLARQPWAQGWVGRDRRGFEQAVAALVDTAQQMARAAAAVPPAQRPAYWHEARLSLLPATHPSALPGNRERELGRLALDWAERSSAPPTDALFEMRPSAWLVVQAGGPDALTQQLARSAASQRPVLWVDTDASPNEPFAALGSGFELGVAVCMDFEAEAQQSAACVLHHLAAGQAPVALIAQDRLLVRRVHALLARQGVVVHDETGWKLSTTRAGASLRSLVTCAQPEASTDDWLNWLKACAGGAVATGFTGAPPALGELDRLELALRGQRVRLASGIGADRLSHGGALWRVAQDHLGGLAALTAQPLARWVSALQEALEGFGLRRQLEADDAGRQVLRALHLRCGGVSDTQGPWAQSAETIDGNDFSDWIDAVLEATMFQPEAPEKAQVVICPLGRAMLRPFQAVVAPGADARHLGATPPAGGLLSEAERRRLGLPDSAERRSNERRALAQMLRLPRVSLLRRRVDNGEVLTPSPLLEWLMLEAQRQDGVSLRTQADLRTALTVAAEPVPRPTPAAPDQLPAQLSASACEALRTCPYRFFALRMLKLQSVDELDASVGKREYGSWLHAVLERFHRHRSLAQTFEQEVATLHQLAREETERQPFDAADFLPFEASFDRLVPRYLEWLHRRDEQRVSWQHAEFKLEAQPPAWDGLVMHGVIDRVDLWQGQEERALELIDYKTGQAAPLQDAIRRHEDTQLAFYAALMRAQPDSADLSLRASYLMLDESRGIVEIAHPEVERSAELLVEGLGVEMARIKAGAALPALGEGRSCEFCEARGLCRRDHWADAITREPPA